MKKKMNLHLLKRHKILLLFLVGIGLPSMLLGYLAFRGIQNDQALLEKTWRDDQHRIGDVITRTINQEISALEQTMNYSLFKLRSSVSNQFLDSLKTSHPLIKAFFRIDENSTIHFPGTDVLFLQDTSIESPVAIFSEHNIINKFHSIEKFEYQQQRYTNALQGYRELFTQFSEPRMKGIALNAVARVQKKLHRPQDAIQTYERLIQEYNHIRTDGGIPLGLAGKLETAHTALALEDTARAVRSFFTLYRDLLHKKWDLERSQFNFFSDEVKRSFQEILKQSPVSRSNITTFSELVSEEQKKRQLTEKLLSFKEIAENTLRSNQIHYQDDVSEYAYRDIIENDETTYLFALIIPDHQDVKNGDGLWGIIIDSESLKYHVSELLHKHVNTDNTGWKVIDNNGKQVLVSGEFSTESLSISTSFPGNFPPWELEFYHKTPRLYETFLTSRSSIYFYSFLLIAGILVFGLILTIRTVNRELELARMKSDFVSTISHEFKSPLTSIRQLSEMLQSGRVPSEERRQKYYNILTEQSERLSMLINNILDFSRIEEGGKVFAFENINTADFLEEVIAIMRDRIQHEGYTIHTDIDSPLPVIQGDRNALTQAVTNLVDNAVKFSGDKKEVIIRAWSTPHQVHIAVQDFGAGIKEEEREKIFERFYRGGEELTRTVKGSGLGLTLVKQIVEAHHGSIEVESEPGAGSTFTISIPVIHR